MSERLGVLGGTFDPIHQGHLDAATAAAEALRLSSVLLVPAGTPPHRADAPVASSWHRFAMAALAAAMRPELKVSDIELRRGGPSYTAGTLAALHREGWGPLQLFFITGADAFAEIASWHDYPTVLNGARFVVVTRPGVPAASLRQVLPDLAERMLEVRPGSGAAPAPARQPCLPAVFLVDAPTADVSSSDIRQRLASGRPIAGLVPPAVEAHILRHDLYRPRGIAADHLHDQT
jgi:nicotinate-nucleotide adenylyltransferase